MKITPREIRCVSGVEISLSKDEARYLVTFADKVLSNLSAPKDETDVGVQFIHTSRIEWFTSLIENVRRALRDEVE